MAHSRDHEAPNHTGGPVRFAGAVRAPLVIGLLVVLVVGVYLQTLGHGWVHWDDDDYVFANPPVLAGLSAGSVRWALTAFHAGTWQPVTWVSYLVDVSFYGPRPGGYHLTSLLLHLTNAILLLLWLRRMTGSAGRSALVAAVFAAHPVNVEAVAWIAGRKDLLAAMFAFLSLLAYARYVRRPSVGRAWPVLGAFVLGLASKPVVMALPALLLLLDVWPLRRVVYPPGRSPSAPAPRRRVLLEKLPLLVLSIVSLAITLLAQRQAGAVSSLGEITAGMRIANAIVSYAAYLGSLFAPVRLACFYPYLRVPLWQVLGSLVLLAGITTLAVRLRHRCPAVLLGWIWYLVALLPSIGLVQIGSHARADRFLYLPMIGIAIAAIWGIETAVTGRAARDQAKRPAGARPAAVPGRALLGATGVVLLALAILGFRQTSFWRDDASLFGHATQVTRENYLAENKLGAALSLHGRWEEARGHFAASVRMNPGFADALVNLGAAEERLGRPDEAIRAFRRALTLAPDAAAARRGLAATLNNLGSKAAEGGRFDEAIELFDKALRVLPDFELARTNKRLALATRAGATRKP